MTGTSKDLSSDRLQTSADLKALKDENELLLLQLCQAQEELELWFTRFHELEIKVDASHKENNSEKNSNSGHKCKNKSDCKAPVAIHFNNALDKELAEAVAEEIRLAALVQTQKWTGDAIAQNSLPVRLGNLLIQAVSPSGSFVTTLGKLVRIWRETATPPAALGGESFSEVIKEYNSGGFEAVTKMLLPAVAPELRAKAYTALGRHLMQAGFSDKAAVAARCAYEDDPKAYRLKWLAFRLHEAGDSVEADACLSLLPQDTAFSDSELRQREQVCFEAKKLRLMQAREHNSVLSCLEMGQALRVGAQRIDDLEQQLREREAAEQKLIQSRDELASQGQASAQRIDDLEQQLREREVAEQENNATKARLEKEQVSLQQELQASRQATTLSIKLQMLREADLMDLQDRYQALFTREESQNKLLAQLNERLNAASSYFHQIINNEGQRLPSENKNNSIDGMSQKNPAGIKGQS